MEAQRPRINFSKRLIDHLINAFLIFASVLLAFWMNEFREERKKIEITQNAKQAILIELKSNLKILENWTPYHKYIVETGKTNVLKHLDTITQFNLAYIPNMDNGIQRQIITNNAWRLLNDSQVSFDIPTKMTINRIYEQQNYVTRATKNITNDFLLQREIFDPLRAKENYLMFYLLLEELWSQEEAMILNLREVIEQFE